MSIDALAEYTNVSVTAIQWWRKRRAIPPPRGKNRWATYGSEHIRAIERIKQHIHDRPTIDSFAEGF